MKELKPRVEYWGTILISGLIIAISLSTHILLGVILLALLVGILTSRILELRERRPF